MKVREQPESLLLNPRRAAVLLGIGWVAFRDLLKRGEIAVVPTGKNRVKVPRRALEEWIEAHSVTGKATGFGSNVFPSSPPSSSTD